MGKRPEGNKNADGKRPSQKVQKPIVISEFNDKPKSKKNDEE